MQQIGPYISSYGVGNHGIRAASIVRWNYTAPALYEHAIRANEAMLAGGPLVVGDKLYIYYSARAWGHVDFKAATGLATLRRDGFASMDAGDKPGTLTTRPVKFSGKYLFVNVDCPEGELRAEVLDKDGKVIEPFLLATSQPAKADSTLTEMVWKGGGDLSELADITGKLKNAFRCGREIGDCVC